MTINPYLNFPGTTEEAFNFYKSVFGGEFVMVQRFRDTPDGNKLSEELKDKIMHISLPIGGSILMATDALESMGHSVTYGNNFHLSVNTDSKEAADKQFAGISAGGSVILPLQDMPWGDYFGMCKDKYGVQWMFSYNEKYKG